jgi:D-alanyl-D-alanine carboxypeptidase/D-alanyl-D-alanine-endopeptidase (penicillin-binding protein 4)
MERLNAIVARGEVLALPETSRVQVSVWKPELYAAQLFREALERNGIPVQGTVDTGTAPPESRLLTTHLHPMDTMMVNLNKISDNLSTENLLKIIGAETAGVPGSAKHGIWKVNEFLSGFGIDTSGHRQVDGSGLSHYNLLTTSMLVQLLEGMYRRADVFPLFYRSLPIAGVDGTLERRMRGTRAEGNLRAKTGTISGVASLSGYVTTADGEWLVFSMTMQNYVAGPRSYRNAQDRIGVLLANFSRARLLAASR